MGITGEERERIPSQYTVRSILYRLSLARLCATRVGARPAAEGVRGSSGQDLMNNHVSEFTDISMLVETEGADLTTLLSVYSSRVFSKVVA